MLSLTDLAYQMIALLYETVRSFTDTWIECLGDLARYRMAIEEEKVSRFIWAMQGEIDLENAIVDDLISHLTISVVSRTVIAFSHTHSAYIGSSYAAN